MAPLGATNYNKSHNQNVIPLSSPNIIEKIIVRLMAYEFTWVFLHSVSRSTFLALPRLRSPILTKDEGTAAVS